jgi:hypothetical protein
MPASLPPSPTTNPLITKPNLFLFFFEKEIKTLTRQAYMEARFVGG